MAKILVLVSSANKVPLQEGGSHSTGIFLGELVEPLERLWKNPAHQIVFASADGHPPTIDPTSLKLTYWSFSKKKLSQGLSLYKEFLAKGLAHPKLVSDFVNEEKLKNCDCLFIPGGHGPMTDLLHENWLTGPDLNYNVGQILYHFHAHGKLTATICHGTSVLAAAPDDGDLWIYNNYQMTCVSMFEEWLVEDAPLLSSVGGHLPLYPAKLLAEKGGIVKTSLFGEVVQDRELISAQNPLVAHKLGQVLAQKLS
jgi:putative intracellular protease/amidase